METGRDVLSVMTGCPAFWGCSVHGIGVITGVWNFGCGSDILRSTRKRSVIYRFETFFMDCKLKSLS